MLMLLTGWRASEGKETLIESCEESSADALADARSSEGPKIVDIELVNFQTCQIRAICTVLLDPRDPSPRSERTQGFAAGPV